MSIMIGNQSNLTRLTNKIRTIFKPASRVVISENAIKQYLDPDNTFNANEVEVLASRIYNRIMCDMWYANDIINYVRNNVVKNRIMFARTRDCEFSTRLNTVLRRCGYKHIIDVLSKSEEELLKLRNMGQVSMAELKAFLAENNLTLLTQNERKHLADCGIHNISVMMCCIPEDLVEAGVNKSLVRRLIKYGFINPPMTQSLLDRENNDKKQEVEVVDVKELNTVNGVKVKKIGDKITNSLKNKSYTNSDRLILKAIANYIEGLDDLNDIKYSAGADTCPKILNDEEWIELVADDIDLLKYTPNRVIYGNRDKMLDVVMRSNYSVDEKLKRIGTVQSSYRTELRRKKAEEEEIKQG